MSEIGRQKVLETPPTPKPDYEKAYWKAIELKEKISNGEITLPYAHSTTYNKIYELLDQITQAPWQLGIGE